MAYRDFKDLARRKALDKVFRGKAFNIATNPKNDEYHRGFVFEKTASSLAVISGSGDGVKSMSNYHLLDLDMQQLAGELHKLIIKIFASIKSIIKVYSSLKDNIWSVNLADIQLISKLNKVIRFLLYVLDIFSKYAWVVPLKDKKALTIINVFQKILNDSMKLHSKRKPNKIWLHKGSELGKSSFKKWLKDNDMKMYSTHNEGKSVVAERFIRTFKNKICKYRTSISKNVYVDKLDDIVNEYFSRYHKAIKMKPLDVKSGNILNKMLVLMIKIVDHKLLII